MSGPSWAEGAVPRVGMFVDVALWPLRMWSDIGVTAVVCAECGSREALMVGRADRTFTIADLTAELEAHIPRCPGPDDRT